MVVRRCSNREDPSADGCARARAPEDERNSVVAPDKVLPWASPWNVSKWSTSTRERCSVCPALPSSLSPSISLPLLFLPSVANSPSSLSLFLSPPPLAFTAVACATARDFPRKSRENYVTSDGFGRNWDKVQCTLALRFTTRCFYAVIFPGLGNTRTVAPCSLEYPGVIFPPSLSPSVAHVSRNAPTDSAPDRETRVSPTERADR